MDTKNFVKPEPEATAIPVLEAKRRVRPFIGSQRKTAALFMLPLSVLVAVFVLVPEAATLLLAFSSWHGTGLPRMVGIGNFVELLRDRIFLHSLINTIVIGGASSILALLIGVALALILHGLGFRESMAYRTILFIPVILPLTIVGLLFKFVLNTETGILNQLLRAVGLSALAHSWLSEPGTAMWALTFVEIWKNAGLPMLLVYSALITIPESLYEAARVDGASHRQMIFHISIPLTKAVTRLSLIYLLILGFKTYDLIFIMTRGGPARLTTTVPIWMVETAYHFNDLGLGASMGVALAASMVAVVGAGAIVLRGKSYEMS